MDSLKELNLEKLNKYANANLFYIPIVQNHSQGIKNHRYKVLIKSVHN